MKTIDRIMEVLRRSSLAISAIALIALTCLEIVEIFLRTFFGMSLLIVDEYAGYLLSCMVFGAVYINVADDKELYHQLNVFTPPIMLLFFVVSGMSLDLKVLASFGLAGVGYFLVRIAGKYLGAWLGCYFTGTDKRIRTYLGAALVPQAGVAIGLAYLSQRMLPSAIGEVLMSMILASSVLYELIGPACAKFALFRSGAIQPKKEEAKPEKAKAEKALAVGKDSRVKDHTVPCQRSPIIEKVLLPYRGGGEQRRR